jgi:hypothetical protein
MHHFPDLKTHSFEELLIELCWFLPRLDRLRRFRSKTILFARAACSLLFIAENDLP